MALPQFVGAEVTDDLQLLRTSDLEVDPLFLHRWSPRGFDGSSIDDSVLLTLFEAARWAPSAYNLQPWRFIFAIRGSEDWDRFVDLLLPFNQKWAQHAAALVFVLSDQMIDGSKEEEPVASTTASFDAGAAWACLALQAIRLGLHSRAMAGFDQVRAREALAVPERFRIEAAVAIGRQGIHEASPEIAAADRPSDRFLLAHTVYAGRFGSTLEGLDQPA